MTDFVKYPEVYQLVQWVVNATEDNTDDITAALGLTGSFIRYESVDGSTTALTYVQSSTYQVATIWVSHAVPMWVGLNPHSVDLSDMFLMVPDNGLGAPGGYAEFSSIYGS